MRESCATRGASPCAQRHIMPTRGRLLIGPRKATARPREGNFREKESFGASMNYASSNNAFNILFTLSFFAGFVAMLVRFG
jgi:hypothetical protein